MIRYTSGVICGADIGEDLDRLQLPLADHKNSEAHAHRVHRHRGRA